MRDTGFNKGRFMKFFENLGLAIEKYKFNPEQNFNIGETGVRTYGIITC